MKCVECDYTCTLISNGIDRPLAAIKRRQPIFSALVILLIMKGTEKSPEIKLKSFFANWNLNNGWFFIIHRNTAKPRQAGKKMHARE